MVLALALVIVRVTVERVDDELVALIPDLLGKARVAGGDLKATINVHTAC